MLTCRGLDACARDLFHLPIVLSLVNDFPVQNVKFSAEEPANDRANGAQK